MALNESGEYRRPTPESLARARYVPLIIIQARGPSDTRVPPEELQRALPAGQCDSISQAPNAYADAIDPFDLPEVAAMNYIRNSTDPLPEALNYPIPEVEQVVVFDGTAEVEYAFSEIGAPPDTNFPKD